MGKKSIYKTSKYFMIAIGIWKLPLSTNAVLQRLYTAYSTGIQAIYITYNLSMIIKAIQIAFDHNGSQNIFGLLSLAVLIAALNVKLTIFKKNGVPYMFRHVIREELFLLNSSDHNICDTYMRYARLYNLITGCQIITTISSVYFYIMFNVYKMATNKLTPGENFMYELWYPFKFDGNGTVMIIIKLILSQMGILFNTGSQVLLQSLLIFVPLHLRILQANLRFALSEEANGRNETERVIIELVKKHQFLIRFVENLNNAVKSVILLEYVLNSLNIAAAFLQIITSKTVVEITFSIVYLVLLVSQLFILAWSTNEISVQSFNVSNAIFESNWFDRSESVKKMLLFILMRAQKPLTLTIGPFSAMNMEAGLMTLKGAYTYAGVMRQEYT